jgi:hypothetical protein
MKKILLLLCITFGATLTYAQVRLNLYGAYAFDDKVDSYYSSSDYYEGTIKGGLQWGGGIEFSPKPDYAAELLYLRQDTHAPIRYQAGIGSQNSLDLDLNLNYLLLSAGRSITLPANDQVEGFANILVGCNFLNASNPATTFDESATKFAWGARIGANVFASENIGIKIHVLMLSIVQGAGGGIYFGTGGSGVGVSTYSTMYQFAVGGALILRK